MGNVMGGVHYTLADFAFAVASNWQAPGVVGINNSIAYLSPIKGKKLIARATLIKDGRATCVYNVASPTSSAQRSHMCSAWAST